MGLDEKEQKIADQIDREYSDELLREENTIEALLFTMGRSVSLDQIAAALELGKKPAEQAVKRLMDRYAKRNGGIRILQLDTRYQMCTAPEYYDALIRVAKQPRKPVLTEVVMETLAIIAYKQPVTKAEIEKIRGVKSDHAVNKLVEYELVEEVGRLNAPGRPTLFATTEEFLRRFGVSSLEELPGLNPEVQAEIEQEVQDEVKNVLGTTDEQESNAQNEDPESAVEKSPETGEIQDTGQMDTAGTSENGVKQDGKDNTDTLSQQ